MEDQAEVVGRHRDALGQMRLVRSPGSHSSLEVVDTPGGLPRSQAVIERGVTRRGVCAMLPERTVQVEDTALSERRVRASYQHKGVDRGNASYLMRLFYVGNVSRDHIGELSPLLANLFCMEHQQSTH